MLDQIYVNAYQKSITFKDNAEDLDIAANL